MRLIAFYCDFLRYCWIFTLSWGILLHFSSYPGVEAYCALFYLIASYCTLSHLVADRFASLRDFAPSQPAAGPRRHPAPSLGRPGSAAVDRLFPAAGGRLPVFQVGPAQVAVTAISESLPLLQAAVSPAAGATRMRRPAILSESYSEIESVSDSSLFRVIGRELSTIRVTAGPREPAGAAHPPGTRRQSESRARFRARKVRTGCAHFRRPQYGLGCADSDARARARHSRIARSHPHARTRRAAPSEAPATPLCDRGSGSVAGFYQS